MSDKYHFGDPCIHCGVAHDDVPPGPCKVRVLLDALIEMYHSACANATSTPSKAAFLKAREAIIAAGGTI